MSTIAPIVAGTAPSLALGPRLGFRRMPSTIKACAIGAALVAAGAILAPWIAPHDPAATHILGKLQPPVFLPGGSREFLLGTDQLGRDILSRCLYGIRVSVGIAFLGLAVGSFIGTTVGLASGLIGGVVDRVLMMLVDVFLTVPFLLLALVGLAVFGTDLPVLVGLVGLAKWESYARVVRGQVLQVRELPFIEASRALGASTMRIAIRHVLPNIASPLIVLLTLNFPSILLLESSLSFLGIGVQPPTASLGRMVGDGRDHLIFAWWVAVMPAAVIVVITFVVQMMGDWLRDALDVRIDG